MEKKKEVQKNMDDYCVITINGSDYYVPSNMVQYINEDGVSSYSSNFYGYKKINTTTSTNYPRITFRPQAYPIYQSSSTATQTVLTSNTVIFSTHAQIMRFQALSSVYEPFLLMVIALFVMFRRFK